LRTYRQTGLVVFARRPISFQDPREHGILPGALTHRLLPPLDQT